MSRNYRNKLSVVVQPNLTEELFIAMISKISLVGGSSRGG